MAKHTINELYQMQSLPLSAKIQMTRRRIKGWVDEEQMSEKYNSSLINTYNTELKALRAELEKMGGRWSD